MFRVVVAEACPRARWTVTTSLSEAISPDATAARLEALGWDVARVTGVGHDFWLQDADRTWAAVRDVLLGERAG